MIANDCQWLPMIANDCQWLPMIANDCQWYILIVLNFTSHENGGVSDTQII